jgi:hypothetical protein
MNVYQIEERVPCAKDENRKHRVVLLVMAESVAEIAEMLGKNEIVGITLVGQLTEFPEQKYRPTASTESDWEQIETDKEVEDVVELLQDVKKLVSDEKRHMVSTQHFDRAARLREAEKILRLVLGEPTSLQQLFLRRHVDESIESLRSVAREMLERVKPENPSHSFTEGSDVSPGGLPAAKNIIPAPKMKPPRDDDDRDESKYPNYHG